MDLHSHSQSNFTNLPMKGIATARIINDYGPSQRAGLIDRKPRQICLACWGSIMKDFASAIIETAFGPPVIGGKSDAAVSQAMIRQSIAAYPGTCPGDIDGSTGAAAGETRGAGPSGYSPVCYSSDISKEWPAFLKEGVRKMRKTGSLTVVAIAAAGFSLAMAPTGAFAWGSEGHQYVGNLAWQLLNPKARSGVRKLLGPGVTLAQAAVWPDCIRSVTGDPSTGFQYKKDTRTPIACDVFGNKPPEVQQMTDYASRNWTNCKYSGQLSQCNLSYHFADVNVHEHSDYAASYFGSEPYDVVHAIEAAETILKCKNGQSCSAPSPFNIANKREALFLIAHFAGDVHQPLHVGAIYLDANNVETGDNGAPTIGGNWLLLSQKENLHHSWDQIPSSLGTNPDAATIASACAILASADPGSDTPEKWASESVAAARTAYSGMTFAPDSAHPKNWDIQLQDPQGYAASRAAVQEQRLVSAGARLAMVLNGLWPSKKVPSACKGIAH